MVSITKITPGKRYAFQLPFLPVPKKKSILLFTFLYSKMKYSKYKSSLPAGSVKFFHVSYTVLFFFLSDFIFFVSTAKHILACTLSNSHPRSFMASLGLAYHANQINTVLILKFQKFMDTCISRLLKTYTIFTGTVICNLHCTFYQNIFCYAATLSFIMPFILVFLFLKPFFFPKRILLLLLLSISWTTFTNPFFQQFSWHAKKVNQRASFASFPTILIIQNANETNDFKMNFNNISKFCVLLQSKHSWKKNQQKRQHQFTIDAAFFNHGCQTKPFHTTHIKNLIIQHAVSITAAPDGNTVPPYASNNICIIHRIRSTA